MAPTVALTGATGFIGRHLAIALKDAGYHVRALIRRDDPALAALGVDLHFGDLESELERFVADSEVVIHVAGAVRGRDADHFHAVNARGSARLAAASGAGSLFLQISSLAARLPEISPYAASKAAGEQLVLAHAGRLRVVVVRPPAVYGPEDRPTLPLFRGMTRGFLPHPRSRDARFSLLYAHDLVQLVLRPACGPAARRYDHGAGRRSARRVWLGRSGADRRGAAGAQGAARCGATRAHVVGGVAGRAARATARERRRSCRAARWPSFTIATG